MSTINNIHARQILDSRGNPTVEVDIQTNNGCLGRYSVPSGASTGQYEAYELRDNNKKYFLGKGVLKAISNVNNIIAPKLKGMSIFDQFNIDKYLIELDGTENKSHLGSNAILGVSLALTKAAAAELKVPIYKYLGGINANLLPIPMINIINGGAHSDSQIAFQEFMIMPVKSINFASAIRIGVEIFHKLKEILYEKKLGIAVGDEGGFAPKLNSIEQALDLIIQAIEQTGYIPGIDIMLALDCAASEFYIDKKYNYSIFEGVNGAIRSSEEQIQYLFDLTKQYPILSIEDGMDQNDWNGWQGLTDKLGKTIQLVGDDLFVTNIKRLNMGIDDSIANSILIKVNQIGTLTETIATINQAKNHGYKTIMSHRSGETEDNIIADLSVAFNMGQIKTGSVSRSERTSKYNQLIRIEESLGSNTVNYPDINYFNFC